VFFGEASGFTLSCCRTITESLPFTAWSTRSVCLFDVRFFCTSKPAAVICQHVDLSNCVYWISLNVFLTSALTHSQMLISVDSKASFVPTIGPVFLRLPPPMLRYFRAGAF
jgi:hypothetical protein